MSNTEKISFMAGKIKSYTVKKKKNSSQTKSPIPPSLKSEMIK